LHEKRVPAALFSAVDPYPEWAEARRRSAVESTSVLGTQTARVPRHADVEAVLRDSETFSSEINHRIMGPYMGRIMLGMDGHRHAQYRSLVSRAFRAAALERWERELVRPTLDELVDAIAPRGSAELVRDVTSRYPVRVIAGIVGVPAADHARFQAWAQEIAMGPADPERGVAASQAMREYLRPFVEARRREPRDDLISDLVHAEIEGQRLDDEDVYGFLLLLMPAGAETTFRVMGNCLVALLSHPEALARLRRDPSLVRRAVEETLRWETSITMVNRVATRDTTIGGCPVAAGSSLLLLTGSANRDEARFEDPDAWNLDRPELPHLAFGWGRHLCLGMHLARLELRIGIETLLARLPGLRLDPDAPPPRIVGTAFRGPERLDVVFDPVPIARPGGPATA
jgi:cytochrome P450